MSNIFTQIHLDKDQNRIPIISMEDTHLVNYLNLVLIKTPKRMLDEARASLLGGYAEEGMDDTVRKSLRLKKVSKKAKEEAEEKLEELEQEYYERIIEKVWPYIIVGVCRDDTRDGVVRILQTAYGVTGKIVLPQYMGQSMLPLLKSAIDPHAFREQMEDTIDDIMSDIENIDGNL